MSTSDQAPPGGDGAIIVLTTTGDDAAAATLAHALVSERLAACVTRMAARSVYRWEKADAAADAICDEQEVLLLIKTARSMCDRIERRILELHPYECPEIVMIDPENVESRYEAWLLAACGEPVVTK